MIRRSVFDVKNYSLDKTIKSGQLFRYKQIGDHAYHLVAGLSACDVWQEREFGPVMISTNTMKDVAFWEQFLDLRDIDDEHIEQLMQHTPKLSEAYSLAKGIRILHQVPWETLICFIISQRNNIPRIKKCVGRICEKVGHPINLYDNAFPEPKALAPGCLYDCGLGYRESYVYNAAHAVITGEVHLIRRENENCSRERALSELERLRGVGPKVARCVALFGLGYTDLFPVDVWIERAVAGGIIDYAYVRELGKYAGLVQQYIYYYMLQINNRGV